MVAEFATIATVSCQGLGDVLPFIFATIRWMVATVADFATVHSNSGSQWNGRAWSVDLLHLNIIKLRFLPAAESVTEW